MEQVQPIYHNAFKARRAEGLGCSLAETRKPRRAGRRLTRERHAHAAEARSAARKVLQAVTNKHELTGRNRVDYPTRLN